MVQSHRYFSWPQKGARNLCRQGIIYNKAISIFIYIVIIYNKWQFTNQEISIYSLRGNFTININQQRETWWTCKSTGKSWISWRKKKQIPTMIIKKHGPAANSTGISSLTWDPQKPR
jgi:hypothetical protein